MGEFVSGRIRYLSKGVETGREWFEMIDHGAGGRTLRALCEMDEFGLTRDVSMLLAPDGRPRDAFCRVMRHEERAGTTLFLCDEDGVECEGEIAALGRLSQRKPVAGGTPYLGLHPLVGDALVALARGTDAVGTYCTVHGIANSVSANGDEGLHAMPTAIDVAYCGKETVTVPAGTFATSRYALRWHPEWEPADLWVHGPEALFIRMDWGMIAASYELVELRRGR
ncbi:hypothetical protein HT136_06535 [Novosphingobium profundi]|uniref:hypothetical protein n=1 Tax=Novosphingobium profundi TaxID=1774954 RepID=UPI001BDB44C7|nr:hypothetical protein [Novosphingobium profundi]MBT0668022.1 hypothetical protein [Novosphingobium profundi]